MIAALVHLVLVVAATPSEAQSNRKDRQRQSEPMYALVKVGDEVRVVKTDEVRELFDWERKRYEDQVAEYRRRQAAAQRSGAEVGAKPTRRSVKVVAKSIRGREAAEVRRERYIARLKGWSRGAFAVIDLGGKYRIISKSELTDLRRTLDEEYKRLAAAHKEAVRKARLEGTQWSEPAPEKPRLRVAPRSFTTELEASIYVREYIEARQGPAPDEEAGG